MLATLLGARIRMAVNSARNRGAPALIGPGLGAVLLVGVYLLARGFIGTIVRFLPGLAPSLLALVLLAVLVVPFLRAFQVVLRNLYLASDLEVLMAAPIRLRTLFGYQLLLTATAPRVAALLGITLMVAYGSAVGAPGPFYPMAILVVALVVACVAAFSVSFVQVIVRVVSPRRIRAFLSLMVLFGALSIFFIAQASGDLSERIQADPEAFSASVTGWSERIDWLPSTWAARALLEAARGDWAGAAAELGLLAAAGTVFAGAGYLLFRNTFYGNWSGVREAPRLRRARPGRVLESLVPLRSWPQALVLKDLRLVSRDLRSMSALVMPVVVVIFFSLRPRAGGGHDLTGLWPVALLIPFLATSFSGIVLSLERRSIALLKAAPISMERLLLAKVASALPLMLVPAWGIVLAVVIRHGASPLQIAGVMAASLLVAAVSLLTDLSLAAGAIDYSADSPAVPMAVGLAGMAVKGLLVGSAAGLVGWAVSDWGGAFRAVLGLLLVVALAGSIGLVLAAFYYGARRLELKEVQ